MDVDVPAPDSIVFTLWLPEFGWTEFLSIPRATLSTLTTNPVSWFEFIGSGAYGADGHVYSLALESSLWQRSTVAMVTQSAEEAFDAVAGVERSPETTVDAEDLEEGESGPKIPVNEPSKLLSVTVEALPTHCYFWSPHSPKILDLCMIEDRVSTASVWGRKAWLSDECKVRDRMSCGFSATRQVFTSREDLRACHIIPHSKGPEYVQLMEEWHQVPQEERMGEVDCLLHSYWAKGIIALLLVGLPNRFLTRPDVEFDPAPRFGTTPYQNPAEEVAEDAGDEIEIEIESTTGSDYLASASDVDEVVAVFSPRRSARKTIRAGGTTREAAKPNIAPPVTETDSQSTKLAEPPFSDDSQIILQHLRPERMSGQQVWATPNNTAATLQLGTRLSATALNAAYICCICMAFSPDRKDPRLYQKRSHDLYGVQPKGGSAPDPKESSNGPGPSTSTSNSATSNSTWASQPTSRATLHLRDEAEEPVWDFTMGWPIPSLIAPQLAEIRRARELAKRATVLKVTEWNQQNG
ncbi:hypothetical protein C8F01DRAFT_1099738 [Mycena amicta]|nr:hypothetical protein C8F01DRAFT_1099738 [Mycena amicta]